MTPNGRRDLLEPAFAQIPAELDWAIDRFGQFPNSIYGNLGVDLYFGYALETQGLSLQSVGLFDPEFLPGRTGQWWFWSSVAEHEITHEWFGNAVSPARWSDLWLNEGFATYSMKLREDENGTIDEWGNPSLEDYMKEQYAQGDTWRVQYGPVARPLSAEGLFSPQAYDGGALVLYALRQEIGEEKFDAILRGWPQRYRGRSVSTDDFIAYASEVSGQDLRGFLGPWVYGETTPQMPGHPDWTINPVTATTTAETSAEHSGAATGTEGREFSVTDTRDFSVTGAWGPRPACLAAPHSSIGAATAAQPPSVCR